MSSVVIIFLASKLHIVVIAIAVIAVLLVRKEIQNQALLLTLFVLPTSYIVGKFAGIIIDNPRPFVVDDFTPLVQHVVDNGFPSDHTQLTATIASIIFVYNKPIGLFIFGLSILVGIGRVLAGVHHYIDVAGSIVIAVTTTYLVTILVRRLLK